MKQRIKKDPENREEKIRREVTERSEGAVEIDYILYVQEDDEKWQTGGIPQRE